jgi:hypothetical protein
MGNMSDDFDFNADDLFDDFEDDDFGGDDFDDDELGGDDDFGADLDLDFMDEDDSGDLGDLGDDDFGDLGDDDFGVIGDTAEDSPQISRPIIIIAGIMLLVLVIFLGLIAFSIFGGDDGFSATSTAIALTNDEINTQISGSATQSSIDATGTAEAQITATAQGTAIAQTDIAVQIEETSAGLTQVVLDQTEAAQLQETANANLTATVNAALDADQQATQAAQDAADAAATEFELTLNPVVESVVPLETMPTQSGVVDLPAVAQTATALASLFEATLTPVDVSGGTEIAAGATQVPDAGNNGTGSTGLTELPNTGLADDLFQAFFGDPRLAILAVFGLLGVIVVSRGVRSANRKKKDN